MPPIYTFECANNHRFEKYAPMERYLDPQTCDCGLPGKKIITAPMIFVAPNVHYDSPIDGRPITSMAARREDLARSNCVPYDPDQKQDYHRRIERSEQELEKAVDETVDRELFNMPARKREKLEAELSGGFTAEPIRVTAPAKPIHTEINK